MAGNAAGWWKFSGGKIDFTFNGIARMRVVLVFPRRTASVWLQRNRAVDGSELYDLGGKLVPVGVSGAIASRAASAKSDTNWLNRDRYNACRTVVFYGQNGCWTAVKNLSCTPGKNSTQP